MSKARNSSGSSTCSQVVSLTQARKAKPVLWPDGTPVPPLWIYDPPKPYLVEPCQVLTLPVKESASSGKK